MLSQTCRIRTGLVGLALAAAVPTAWGQTPEAKRPRSVVVRDRNGSVGVFVGGASGFIGGAGA